MSAVLAGLADAAGFDARGCDGYVGTSAGSIVAAALVAGTDPGSRLGELPEQPPVPASAPARGLGLVGRALEAGISAGSGVAAPLAVAGLRWSEPGGALLRRAALARAPAGGRSLDRLGGEIDRSGARWDGRLSVSAVQVETGRRVMFGTPGLPRCRSATRSRPRARYRACSARSCSTVAPTWTAAPGARPTWTGRRLVVGRGSFASTRPGRCGRAARCPSVRIGMVSRSVAAIEALALQRRGARVTVVAPDPGSLAAMGPNLMDAGPRARVIAAGHWQGQRLGRRPFLTQLGLPPGNGTYSVTVDRIRARMTRG